MSLRLSLVVFALLASGCASPPGGDGDASQVDCPRGLARPFSIQTLIRVGQENGVSLKRDPSCGGLQNAIESASNVLITDDVHDDDEVYAREGHVLCHIEDLPFAKPPFRVQRTKYATDEETHLDVANVHCSIYPEAAEQIDRLERAFKALAQAPVEQRSCPRGPPKPISVARLIDAAKKEGLPLLRDARCMEPGVVAQASTLIPYKREKVSDIEIFTDYGEVTCLVRKSAAPGAEEIRTTDLSSGERLDFRNVSCTVLTSQEKETTHAKRVRATLEALG
jgi:hypothetical protein